MRLMASIAKAGRFSRHDRPVDGFSEENGLLQLLQEMDVRLDCDGALEDGSEGPRKLAVARSGIDEHLANRETIHDLLEPAVGVPLLIRMAEEDLKGVLVGLALGVEHAHAFLIGHHEPPWSMAGCGQWSVEVE
jgi:hypothetical protein